MFISVVCSICVVAWLYLYFVLLLFPNAPFDVEHTLMWSNFTSLPSLFAQNVMSLGCTRYVCISLRTHFDAERSFDAGMTRENRRKCYWVWSAFPRPQRAVGLMPAPYQFREPGQLAGYSAGLVIERLRVRIPAGEFSSPEFTLCADSYSVSVPPSCYRSGT